MLSKNKQLSNFSRALQTTSDCYRPENEQHLSLPFNKLNPNGILARGNGTSYSDCCVNHEGAIIDTTRLNHLISFDENSGLLICQGGVSFSDLFLVSPKHIPPVIPGTLKATVAGGLANDVHGKNNHQRGNFGQHLRWVELQLGAKSYHCSPESNPELFYATIAGLGLTGLIKRVALTMTQASHFVLVQNKKFTDLGELLHQMQTEGCHYDYQVAWLDLLNKPRAILSLANHSELSHSNVVSPIRLPRLPFRLITPWVMKLFNHYYFHQQPNKPQLLSLPEFNNPLDSVQHWNHLYGKKGLLQFQAVFDASTALSSMTKLFKIVADNQATATLAVLKYFTQSGVGLLSFAQPGFTLAIDFINNDQAHKAIAAMNELISEINGKIYLAKDRLLTKEQFIKQYPQQAQFKTILEHYKSPMRSDLSCRLGITL